MKNQNQQMESLIKYYDSQMRNPNVKFGGRIPCYKGFLSTIKTHGWVIVSKWCGGRDYVHTTAHSIMRVSIREKDGKAMDYCFAIRRGE